MPEFILRNPLWVLRFFVFPLFTFIGYFPIRRFVTGGEKPVRPSGKYASFALSLLVGTLGTSIVGVLTISDLAAGTAVVRNHQVLAYYPQRTQVWKIWGHPDWTDTERVSCLASPVFGSKTVEALTARKVEITVELRRGGNLQEFADYLKSDWADRADEKLRSALNRFDNQHHSVVAERFYDDTNESQQQELQHMFWEFINPEIAGKGILLHSVRFRLP